jgi:hypothetical protein
MDRSGLQMTFWTQKLEKEWTACMNKSNEEWIQLNIQILVQQFSLQSDNMLTSHVE